jgi:hypothetical protein
MLDFCSFIKGCVWRFDEKVLRDIGRRCYVRANMSEQQFTIADLEQMVAEHEASAARVKTIINELCIKSGLPVRYAPSELERRSAGAFKIRSDQFHGRPLATCVRELLEARRSAGMGPPTTNEIFDSLVEGAYEVGAKNAQVGRVSLYNSLTKNPAFYKLPNKTWGLREWYPTAANTSNGDDKVKKSGAKKRQKTKKPEKAATTVSATQPAAPAEQSAAAPANGAFSAQALEGFVREKNRRMKDVTRHFSVTKATVKKLVREPGSKVYQAEKGWLKIRENP